jgi:hypothetical protein
MAGKYDHIDFKPPKSVADAAARGLALRQKAKKSHKGGLTTGQANKEGVGSGVQRAVNLKNRDTMSPSSVKRMLAFFQRHEKNIKVDKDKTPATDRGYIAGALWGGQPGYAWARKVVRQMEAADRKSKKAHQNAADYFLKTAKLEADFLSQMSLSDLVSLAGSFDAAGYIEVADTIDHYIEIVASDSGGDYTEEQVEEIYSSDYRDYSAEEYARNNAEQDIKEMSSREIAEELAKDIETTGLSAQISESPMYTDIKIGEDAPILLSIDHKTKEILVHDGYIVFHMDPVATFLDRPGWTAKLFTSDEPI